MLLPKRGDGLTITNLDLRDPKITRAPDGRLLLYATAADRPKTPITYQSLVWSSKDARTWSAPTPVGETNNWLWRVAWNAREAFGVGYTTRGERLVRLYKSSNGESFQTILPNLHNEQSPNETALIFDSNETLYCLVRREGTPGHGLFGSAPSPYTNWTWKDTGAKIGGPQIILLPDGRLIAGVRLYDGGARMSIVQIDRDSGKLTELVKLPSGGDCSYPGMVWHENQLFVSYYSSHEKKTMIYFARLKFE